MSQVCQICQKGRATGNNVSFSQRKTKRTWSPNIVRAKINIGGESKKVKICSKCLKKLS